jgi:transcriptional regulator with XRE-family HTH domain
MGWTQEQLAERISTEQDYVRQSEVSRLERDHVTLPRRARLERIAAALQLPIGELLARSGWVDADIHMMDADPRQALPWPNAGGVDPQQTRRATRGYPGPSGRGPEPARPEADAEVAFESAMDRLRDQRERLEHNRQVAEALLQRIAGNRPTTRPELVASDRDDQTHRDAG